MVVLKTHCECNSTRANQALFRFVFFFFFLFFFFHFFATSFLTLESHPPPFLPWCGFRANTQWVVQSNELPQQHLSGTIHRLKAFNAKRKWRAVATVVMMGARLRRRKRDRTSSEEKAGHHGCERWLVYQADGTALLGNDG